MVSTPTPPDERKTIPGWIKLEFTNTSNLKTDIQNRISNNTEMNFVTALNDVKGDHKSGDGISFSEITLRAMAFFIDKIFDCKLKEEHYTLHMVKGFLDANNLSPYTAIHEVDVEFFQLKDNYYFRHCWLIIQSAWFFNSQHFGTHQHIEYLDHYSTTGNKLPSKDYLHDLAYLEKKYLEIDQNNHKSIFKQDFHLVGQWYHAILFVVLEELHLPTKHFKIVRDDNREYNPLTKTSRQIRPLMPFKINECDIKSAFPTFLDIETGAKNKDVAYSNIMDKRALSRDQAKVLFNKMCNSGAYNCEEETVAFLIDCGYTFSQSKVITNLTHDNKRKFFSYMTEYESTAIAIFVKVNGLERGVRLHDSILFIDDKIKPELLNVELTCEFGYSELNKPIVQNSFSLSKKDLPYAYMSSVPQGLKLISHYHEALPDVLGEANGFKIFKEKYHYISAGFNVNNPDMDCTLFLQKCSSMFSTFILLNSKHYSPVQLLLILKHIRAHSNLVFNVRALFKHFVRYEGEVDLVEDKYRDFSYKLTQKFKTKLQFLNALNKARGLVTIKNNHNDLFDLIEERIMNEDYSFLTEINIAGRKKNNLLAFAIAKKFNLLVSGRQRKERQGVKSYPLYTNPIKSVTIKSMSLQPQQQNAYLRRSIIKYEKQLKEFNKLVNNRELVKQLLLLLGDITEKVTNLKILKDDAVQKELKSDLWAMTFKTSIVDVQNNVIAFDKQYIDCNLTNVPLSTDLKNIFETKMENSIFNQTSIESAHTKGNKFINEYLDFHGYEVLKDKIEIPKIERKINYVMPEIDFDVE